MEKYVCYLEILVWNVWGKPCLSGLTTSLRTLISRSSIFLFHWPFYQVFKPVPDLSHYCGVRYTIVKKNCLSTFPSYHTLNNLACAVFFCQLSHILITINYWLPSTDYHTLITINYNKLLPILSTLISNNIMNIHRGLILQFGVFHPQH